MKHNSFRNLALQTLSTIKKPQFGRKTIFCFFLLAGLLLMQSVWAQSIPPQPYLSYLYNGYTATYTIDVEGRKTSVYEWRRTALKSEPLDRLKRVSYGFSTSIEKGEFLEAYTVKKDGRRVDAPTTNYQVTTNNGRASASPLFSDQTNLSVVFPDFEVGDAAHVKYRVTETEPMFSRRVSIVEGLSPFDRFDQAIVTLIHPNSLHIKTEAYGFNEKMQEASNSNIATRQWLYSNSSPRQWSQEEDEGLWRMNEGVVVRMSNFSSHEEIAKLYGERALPKAAVTLRIQKLSDEIAGKLPKSQRASALYNWVSHNITYGGNCIGVGAVVPRDVDVVLDNKMGDCKDHATLLQALLAAQAIASEQVLVNASDQYELSSIPVVSNVNHVINFLPEQNIYLDATAKQVPFGYLPQTIYNKPGLHVDKSRPGAKLPHEDSKRNIQTVFYKLRISADGAASGSMQIHLQGASASPMRYYHNSLSGEKEKNLVREMLATWRMKGRGTLDKKDASAQDKLLNDQYEYSYVFEIDDFLRSDANKGSFFLNTSLPSPLDVTRFSDNTERIDHKRHITCHGFLTKERLEIELPAGMRILSTPRLAKLQQTILDYSATYKQVGRVLTVEREINDRTPTSVCAPDFQARFNRETRAVARNLSTPVVYEISKPSR